MPHPERYTPGDALTYLQQNGIRYSEAALKKRRKAHPTQPAFKKIGGRIFYSVSSLDNFIAGVSP